jgi:hypothetical protein
MEAPISAVKNIAGPFSCMAVSGMAMPTVSTPQYHEEIVLLGWQRSKETRLEIGASQMLCGKTDMRFF